MGPLMEIVDLSIGFATAAGELKAVDHVSLTLEAGQSLGLVGESGCGKSTLAFALMRLLPANGRILSGHINLEGRTITELSEDDIRRLRWQHIAIVFQNAMTALNPVLRIGDQMIAALQEHQEISRDDAIVRAESIFETVGLSKTRLMNYPHEFSGGMKQRVMMALALVCGPKILLADEPTTALDVVAQRQVLDLLKKLKRELGLSLVLISHDISAMAEICDRVVVMYAGQIVEEGPTHQVLLKPHHPYTQGLVASIPSLFCDNDNLTSIEGNPPSLLDPPKACRFAPRCSHRQERCTSVPPAMVATADQRQARCHFAIDFAQAILKAGGPHA